MSFILGLLLGAIVMDFAWAYKLGYVTRVMRRLSWLIK